MEPPDAESETRLPFDVEVERPPAWVYAASGAVVLTGLLVASKLVPMLALLPFLVASSIGRRVSSRAIQLEVFERAPEGDAERLRIGAQEVAKEKLHDIWLDDDDAEPRVTIAHGDAIELDVCHFVNREQARRFAGALTGPRAVAGHRPRAIDALACLRFLALAIALVGTGSWLGIPVALLFGVGATGFIRAKQAIANDDAFEIRTALGRETHPYSNVASVDVDAGVIALVDGREVALPPGSIRDVMLASPAWVERARQRVLRRIESRIHQR